MQEHIEQALALGGGAMKCWYETKRDAKGDEIPDTGHISIGFCMADQFVPTAWITQRLRTEFSSVEKQKTGIITLGLSGTNGTGSATTFQMNFFGQKSKAVHR